MPTLFNPQFYHPKPHMISAHDTTRISLERNIIGLCLTHPMAFGECTNILSEKNFSSLPERNINHQLIWRIMSEMYPQQSIDIVSVTHFAKHYKLVDNSILFELTQCSNCTTGIANLWTHAFMLVEFDLQHKFLNQLITVGISLSPTDNLVAKAAVEECVNLMKDKMLEDVLADIPALVEYLGNHSVPDELLQDLQNLAGSIDKKILSVQKQKTIDTILTALRSYGEFQPAANTKAAINNLTEMISILYLTQKATPEFLNQLRYLKQQLIQA